MNKPNEERDVYYIPPNFLTSGRLLGGMIRARNAVEACVLVILTGIPIWQIPISLTARIIILCLIPLPLGIFAIVGFEGDSLSEFVINWFRWLSNRRILYRSDVEVAEAIQPVKKRKTIRRDLHANHQPPDELGIKIKDTSKDCSNAKSHRDPLIRLEVKVRGHEKSGDAKAAKKHSRRENTAEDTIPITDIRNGIIHMNDGRYIKILEVEPINFLLRSIREQRNIISGFASWMKISPVNIQIKVLTKKADIGKHLRILEQEMEHETNEKCLMLQQDYYHLIQTLGSREAITRRFLIIFEYEQTYGTRKPDYTEIVSTLETATRTARQYFQHCDNEVVVPEDENKFLLDILYSVIDRNTCELKPLEERIKEIQIRQATAKVQQEITVPMVLAPQSIDLRHGTYVVMDGVFHAYLMVPSSGYNSKVVAGWTSMLVNAGEGIDVDFFFKREPKDRIQNKLGQQIRINRSRIKDASDTNTDFDDFEGAIRAGYYLKQGLANYEDFYYTSILVTITADSQENLEWRIAEVTRLMVSQDMDIRICRFRQEDAMLSVLPFGKLNKTLFDIFGRQLLPIHLL